MRPSPERIAHRHLLRLAEAGTFTGIDIRSYNARRASWWVDLGKLIEEWYSFNKVAIRVVRGKLVAKVVNRGSARDISIEVRGPQDKPTVYVWTAEKKFGPNDSLRTIMYWIDSITRPGASSSSGK